MIILLICFFAGFIGIPQMNFANVAVIKEDEEVIPEVW